MSVLSMPLTEAMRKQAFVADICGSLLRTDFQPGGFIPRDESGKITAIVDNITDGATSDDLDTAWGAFALVYGHSSVDSEEQLLALKACIKAAIVARETYQS